jgi:hypothetical protein
MIGDYDPDGPLTLPGPPFRMSSMDPQTVLFEVFRLTKETRGLISLQYHPSQANPYRIVRSIWGFESTLGLGDSWESALLDLLLFLCKEGPMGSER